MCVILVAKSTRPSAALLRDCANANRDGGGIAWREKGRVHWFKSTSLTHEQVARMSANLPFPFVVHFRIATVGGVNDELCHPFPVTADVEHEGAGNADAVVFHNGHWGNWKETLVSSVTTLGLQVPDGPWSDSRAMAFLAHNHGMPFLQLIPDSQRVVYLGARRLVVSGAGWSNINDGLQVSNTNWATQTYLRTVGQKFSKHEQARGQLALRGGGGSGRWHTDTDGRKVYTR